jgi:hypothetical protein
MLSIALECYVGAAVALPNSFANQSNSPICCYSYHELHIVSQSVSHIHKLEC